MSLENDDLKKKILESNKIWLSNTVHLLEGLLDFQRWGFQQSFSLVNAESAPYIIYDSGWCRVKFDLGGVASERHRGPSMDVYYGRLHAPNIDSIIGWKGEQCWAWHRVNNALNFLDGLSPQQSVDQWRLNNHWLPDIPMQFVQSEVAKKISPDGYPSPELVIRIQGVIWEHYGQRLFELFDLRRPDLWEQFTRFVGKYNKIAGLRDTPGLPRQDAIC